MGKRSAAKDAKELEKLERGARVVELRKAGASFRQIAQKLNDEGIAEVTYQTVRRDFMDAMQVARSHRKDEADDYFELQAQRMEGIMLAFWLLSVGTVKVTDENGVIVKTVVPPSVSAAYVYMTAWKNLNEHLYGSTVKHEHTGKNGGSIQVEETKVYAGFDPTKV